MSANVVSSTLPGDFNDMAKAARARAPKPAVDWNIVLAAIGICITFIIAASGVCWYFGAKAMEVKTEIRDFRKDVTGFRDEVSSLRAEFNARSDAEKRRDAAANATIEAVMELVKMMRYDYPRSARRQQLDQMLIELKSKKISQLPGGYAGPENN